MNEALAKKFQEAHVASKTWKDSENVSQMLTSREREELIQAMEIVKAFMGLDMRQEFYLCVFKGMRG
jgi:hypothetical protein